MSSPSSILTTKTLPSLTFRILHIIKIPFLVFIWFVRVYILYDAFKERRAIPALLKVKNRGPGRSSSPGTAATKPASSAKASTAAKPPATGTAMAGRREGDQRDKCSIHADGPDRNAGVGHPDIEGLHRLLHVRPTPRAVP